MKKLFLLLLPLLLTGCAAGAGTPDTPDAPVEPPSPVYTDWSKLTPYEPVREVYSYHAGYRAGEGFTPRGDYGTLLPYIGKYSVMEQYVIDALPFYGLVTDKGELVSDPVYAVIRFVDGFLMLYRGDPENGVYGGDSFAGAQYARTLAAPDGRWAYELADSYYVASGSGLLLTATEDGSIAVWNTDGEIIARFDGAAFRSQIGEEFIWGDEGGPFINLMDDKVGYVVSYLVNGEYLDEPVRLYLDLAGGRVMADPPDGYPSEIDYASLEDLPPVPPEVEACGYYDPITDPVTGKTYFLAYRPGGEGAEGHYALFDSAGKLLVENADMSPFETYTIVRAGLCSTLEVGYFCFRSLADHSLVFRYHMRTNSD